MKTTFDAFPPEATAKEVPDAYSKQPIIGEVHPTVARLSQDDIAEYIRLQQLVIQEPTSERRRQELRAFEIAKSVS